MNGEVRADLLISKYHLNNWMLCLMPQYGRLAAATAKAGCLRPIQKKDVLLHLNELVREGFQHWIPDDDYPGKLAIKERSQKEGYNFYHKAPTLIIASNRPNYENAMADCALALQNIFLAAQSLRLGSCYINQLHWLRDDPSVRAYLLELGIPKEHTICSSAAIGFIGAESPAPIRKEGTIHIIR